MPTATKINPLYLSTSPLSVESGGELKFFDSGSNYIGFQAPTTVSSSVIWVLPSADGTTGQILSSDGSGTLSWIDPGATVAVSDTAPSGAENGDLWWKSDEGRLFIYYEDGSTNQWVDAVPNGGASNGTGTNVTTSDTAPSNPQDGDLWWKSDEAKLYIYYQDTNTAQWVETSPPVIINGVFSASDGSESLPSLHFSSDADTGLWRPTDNTLAFSTGGGEKVRITSNGSVGINTVSPGAKLHVAGYTLIGPDGTTNQYQGVSLIHGRDSSANIATSYIDFRNDLNTVDGHMFVDHQTDGGSTIIFGTTPAGDRATDRRVERLRINSSGSLILKDPTGVDSIAFTHDGSNGSIINSGGELLFYAEGSQRIIFHTNTIERLRITDDGQVLIGTNIQNSFNGVGQAHNLIVAGESSNTAITSNSKAAITISNTDGTPDNTAGLHFAREDTDGNPHYAGASIVAQFKETQVTGQYPKADLAFLTSVSANNAPRESMRIHASGNITTPYQAAFFANGAGGWTDLIDGGKIYLTDSSGNSKLNNTNRNSSYYDSANARFTAPVTGLYHISVTLYVNNQNSANVCSIVPRVNGAELQPNDILFFFSLTYSTSDFAQSGSVNLYLNAGDYVEIYKRAGNAGTNRYYKGHSNWCGHLLG